MNPYGIPGEDTIMTVLPSHLLTDDERIRIGRTSKPKGYDKS